MEEKDDEAKFRITSIKGRPILVRDEKELLKKVNKVNKAYDYISFCGENTRKILEPIIINIACDAPGNMCYQLGFEDLDVVDKSHYHSLIVMDLFDGDKAN